MPWWRKQTEREREKQQLRKGAGLRNLRRALISRLPSGRALSTELSWAKTNELSNSSSSSAKTQPPRQRPQLEHLSHWAAQKPGGKCPRNTTGRRVDNEPRLFKLQPAESVGRVPSDGGHLFVVSWCFLSAGRQAVCRASRRQAAQKAADMSDSPSELERVQY